MELFFVRETANIKNTKAVARKKKLPVSCVVTTVPKNHNLVTSGFLKNQHGIYIRAHVIEHVPSNKNYLTLHGETMAYDQQQVVTTFFQTQAKKNQLNTLSRTSNIQNLRLDGFIPCQGDHMLLTFDGQANFVRSPKRNYCPGITQCNYNNSLHAALNVPQNYFVAASPDQTIYDITFGFEANSNTVLVRFETKNPHDALLGPGVFAKKRNKRNIGFQKQARDWEIRNSYAFGNVAKDQGLVFMTNRYCHNLQYNTQQLRSGSTRLDSTNVTLKNRFHPRIQKFGPVEKIPIADRIDSVRFVRASINYIPSLARGPVARDYCSTSLKMDGEHYINALVFHTQCHDPANYPRLLAEVTGKGFGNVKLPPSATGWKVMDEANLTVPEYTDLA